MTQFAQIVETTIIATSCHTGYVIQEPVIERCIERRLIEIFSRLTVKHIFLSHTYAGYGGDRTASCAARRSGCDRRSMFLILLLLLLTLLNCRLTDRLRRLHAFLVARCGFLLSLCFDFLGHEGRSFWRIRFGRFG